MSQQTQRSNFLDIGGDGVRTDFARLPCPIPRGVTQSAGLGRGKQLFCKKCKAFVALCWNQSAKIPCEGTCRPKRLQL